MPAKDRSPAARRKPASAARGKTSIDLYYWPTPNGFKISIMLEECRLPYTMIPLNIARGDQFKPEFLAISPNNRMPAIVDHDGPGGRPISVFESGAILRYLGRKTGKFYPRDERGRVEVKSGFIGRWRILVRRPGRRTISVTMRRPRNSSTPSNASPTRSTGFSA